MSASAKQLIAFAAASAATIELVDVFSVREGRLDLLDCPLGYLEALWVVICLHYNNNLLYEGQLQLIFNSGAYCVSNISY